MSDYSALAQRVSFSIAGIRGCSMLSRDGLILGAHPEGEPEADLRRRAGRGVGDPERSYVEFPDQIWAFVRRGSYAAFAVAEVGVRPGVLVDTLEQALLSAEQERVATEKRCGCRTRPSAPSGKPRTSLHMPDRQPTPEPEVARADVADDVPASETPPEEEVASTPPPEIADAQPEEPEPRTTTSQRPRRARKKSPRSTGSCSPKSSRAASGPAGG